MNTLHLYCKLYGDYKETPANTGDLKYQYLGKTFALHAGLDSSSTPSAKEMRFAFHFEDPVNRGFLVKGFTELGYTAEWIANLLNMSVANVYYRRKNPYYIPWNCMREHERICSLVEGQPIA